MNDYMEKRIAIFATQAAALEAAVAISRAAGLEAGTILYDQPRILVDGRWCLRYPAFDAWLANVGVHTVADGLGLAPVGEANPVVVAVPASVTNFQARAVLMRMPSLSGVDGRSLFDDVNDALLAQGGLARQAWEYANDVTRDGPLVNSLGEQLGMTADQLDALFVAAAGISA